MAGEMWDRLFARVDTFKSEVRVTTDIVAEAEKAAKAVSGIAATADSKAEIVFNMTRDAAVVAWTALALSFLSHAIGHPRIAGATKDKLIARLEQYILSREALDLLDKTLSDMCDVVEEELL